MLKQAATKQLKKDELSEIYTFAINFCINNIIQKKVNYNERLFEVYLLLIENNLIYDGKYLKLSRVKNIVSLACQLGKTDWAEEFINSRKSEIAPEHRWSATCFFLATTNFYKKDYKGTISQLNEIRKDIDVFYYINTKSLQIRSYYELNEVVVFENQCKTFNAFLRRNKKLSTQGKKAYLNFTKIASQLFRIKEGFSKKRKSEIITVIENTSPLSHNDWLLNKAKEL